MNRLSAKIEAAKFLFASSWARFGRLKPLAIAFIATAVIVSGVLAALQDVARARVLNPGADSGTNVSASPASKGDFHADGDHFVLNGQPFRIISGEMHYPRIPHEYWRSRLKAAKAMGLNAVTAYVFWNVHEKTPGVYDFSGDLDVAEFVREAQREGLYVILRPGPYVCAEWDLGGLPPWLLKDQTLKLRTTDPKFLEPVRRWMARLGQELAPLLISRGGPIIAVQVENEYGSFGTDHNYVDSIRQIIRQSGFADAFLYTADGITGLAAGSLPDLMTGVNFGQGEAEEAFQALNAFQPNGPKMATEYWVGWFDQWGDGHHTTSIPTHLKDMRYMLQQNYSMSLYMFHGGTSFGWMSGADFSEAGYEPYVTSYDYDAPLDESGRITKKYKAMRDLFAQETKAVLPEMPVAPEAMVVADFQTDGARSLWSSLPEPVRSAVPLSMEDIDQGYGYILYRTNLLSIAAPETGDLVLDGLNDYAQVFINQQLVGVLDRRHGQTTLPITLAQQATQLDILVLNSGRVNYSTAIQGERKGIRGATFKSQPVLDWQMFALPMANTTDLVYSDTSCVGPCFFTATFQLSQSAKHADTFLDITGLRKGMVWLNGRPLGRVWNIGPQKTLFVPGVWLQSGANRLTIFESDSAGGGPLSFRGLDHPVFEPVHPMPIPTEPKPPQPPKPGNNPAPNADSKSHGTGGATSGSTPSLTPSPTPSSAPSTATASGAPGAQPSGPSLVPSASPQPSSSPRGFVSGARIPDFSYHFTHHFNGHSRGQSSAGSLSEQLDHE